MCKGLQLAELALPRLALPDVEGNVGAGKARW